MFSIINRPNSPKILFAMAIVLYIVMAFTNFGFFYPDEHFQIIEFAEYKAGNIAQEDLPWEFSEGMRSGLMPFISYSIFKVTRLVGITNPFVLTAILRFFSALVSLIVLCFLYRQSNKLLSQKYRNLYLFFLFFLWFLPLLNVRFSSESWSGLAIVATVALLLNRTNAKQLFLSGFLIGLAFLFRYQTGIIAVSILIWLKFIQKISIKHLLPFFGGILTSLLIGFFADFWLYEKFCFPASKYFYTTLLSHDAPHFGDSSWYYYLWDIIYRPTPILGLLILFSLVYLVLKSRKSLLVFAIIPFLVIHQLIPHKEYRFLFPLLNFIPLILVYFWEYLDINFRRRKILRQILPVIYVVVIVFNFAALAVVVIKPSGACTVTIPKTIYSEYKNDTIGIIYLDSKQYFPLFYKKSLNCSQYIVNSIDEIDQEIIEKYSTYLLTAPRRNYNFKDGEKLNDNFYVSRKVSQSIPLWYEKMNRSFRLPFSQNIPQPFVYFSENYIIDLYLIERKW